MLLSLETKDKSPKSRKRSDFATYKRSNESTSQKSDDVRPNWHSNILGRGNDDTKDESHGQDDKVPPGRDFLVFDQHGSVMPVLGDARSESFDGCPDVFSPE